MIKKIYRKLVAEKIRIKIRNIQYFIWHIFFKIKFSIYKKLNKNNKKNLSLKNKKPSIFYIIPTTKITGGVAVCCEHLNRLKKLGYKVLFVSYDNKTNLSWFPNQKVKVTPLKNSKKILEKFDIGVATGWITAYELALLDVKRKIYFVQSDERRFYSMESFLRKRVEETYKMPFEFMTEAKWIQKWLKKEFNQKAFYVPNGVNTEIFYPDTPLIPKKKGIIRVLVEGAANLPFKGVEEALKLLEEIKKEITNLEVVYVNSDGTPKKEWKYDYYFEKVPMNKMRYIYSSCNFLLKLSKVEGFSGPPVEMITCGRKVIISKNLLIEEYLKNKNIKRNLILFKNKNNLVKLLKNKAKVNKNKKNNNKSINYLNWENNIKKLEIFIKNEK